MKPWNQRRSVREYLKIVPKEICIDAPKGKSAIKIFGTPLKRGKLFEFPHWLKKHPVLFLETGDFAKKLTLAAYGLFCVVF